jgi:NADH-quinone oxidoreductase subunit C
VSEASGGGPGGRAADQAAAGSAGTAEEAQAGEDQGSADTEEQLLHGCPVTEVFGQRSVHTDAKGYLALMEALYRDGFEACMGVTGVDYMDHPGRSLPDGVKPERFEVVAELVSFSRRERLRVRCQVPADDPVVPSLFDLWPGVEAHERETFDMFGVRFADHPDLTRILMPEDWEGHPLRKDYPTGAVPVRFKEVP